MSLLRFLRGGGQAAPGAEARAGRSAETDTVRRIAAQLDAMDPAQATYVASFAYVLSRVAYSDMDISAAETREMERLVVEWAGLQEPVAVLVVEIAKTQARLEGATEDFLVTRRFRDVSTVEQRTALLHCLFAVASAAGDAISAEENATIREISDELGFTLAELNAVRRQYADRLSALGHPSTPGDPAT